MGQRELPKKTTLLPPKIGSAEGSPSEGFSLLAEKRLWEQKGVHRVYLYQGCPTPLEGLNEFSGKAVPPPKTPKTDSG